MRRRAFLALAGAAAAWSRIAAAQQPAPPRIGWLKIQDRNDTPGWLAAFRGGLREAGREEGRGFILDERYGDGDGDATRLASLAEELVRSGVQLIVATSQPATDAARRVTATVPIVGRMTDDPVQSGAARSLAQPGGNVTGIYSLLEEMSPKRLALLREAVPALRRVGALLTLDRGATRHWLSQTEAAARQLGIDVLPMDVHNEADLAAAFESAGKAGVAGLIAFRNPTIVTHARRVVELCNRYRMPAVFDARDYVELGGLMSYGPNLDAVFRGMAVQADKILRGAKPGEIPIEQPARFELVVNAKAARGFDLALAPAFLAGADEVIE